MVKLKSETMTHVLKMLLWALVALGSLDAASMIVYASDYEAFLDFIYPYYGFIDVVSYYLYFIIVVVYLIWIYRVHMDMQSRFPRFFRSPGMALVCTMVPFYNLYGIPSIYRTIGREYMNNLRLQKLGRTIHRLGIPLLLLLMLTGYTNRYIAGTAEVADGLLLWSSFLQLALYVVFLQLCLKVSQGLEDTTIPVVEPVQDEQAAPTAL